jgi:hypothetical protein
MSYSNRSSVDILVMSFEFAHDSTCGDSIQL